MKRVLIISHYFPPTGGGAVQRPAKFVKYMRKYGFEPIVLTAENPSVPVRDESMSLDITEDIKVIKARTLEPSYEIKKTVMKKGKRRFNLETLVRSLLIPDPQVLWIPGFTKKVLSLRKEPLDLIFTTAPPFSSLVAGVVAKFILRRPLVLDFRDEWVGWLDGSSWTTIGANKGIRARLEKMLEHFIVGHAEAVVSASPGYLEAFERKYPTMPAEKFTVITNGYDPEDFEHNGKKEDYQEILRQNKFNLLYVGTVFPLTSLRYFLKGVSKTEIRKNLNLVIVGRITPDEESILDAHSDISMDRLGYWPHSEAIKLSRHADALLLTLSPLKGAERVVPAKLFEYLALGRTILAVMPQGSASGILGDFPGCNTVDPRDEAAVCRAFQELFEKWQNRSLNPVFSDVSMHSREKKTEALCAFFDKVLEMKPC